MKKLILSAVAVATLFTTVASATTFNKSTKIDACHTYDASNMQFRFAYSKFRNGDDTQKYIQIMGTAQGIEQAFTNMYGAISVNYLRNLGVGVSTQTTYKNFVVNYISFIDLLIANDLTKQYTALVAVNVPRDTRFTAETTFLMNNTEGYMNILEPNYLLKNYIVEQTFDFSDNRDKERSIKKIIKYIFLGETKKAAEEVSKWSYDHLKGYCSQVGVRVK